MKSMSLEILSGSTATLLLSTPTSLNVAGTAGTAGFREIVLILYLIFRLELVSKELNHFGMIADLFRQIGGHSSRFVLFCSF